jgi:amino acid permease
MPKKKTIGFVGGVSLLVNNITGPAMVTVPLLFQGAGWIVPTLCLLLMTVLSTLAASFICEAMAIVPHNSQFELRVEFSTLVHFFFGKVGQIVAQIFINISLQCANIAAIIECSQIADDAVIRLFHKTCGLELHPTLHMSCVSVEAVSDSPFPSDAIYLFTIGLFVTMIIVLPMSFFNLDDNIYIQIVAEIFLIIITLAFVVTFIVHGLEVSNMPAFNSSGVYPVFGVTMANFAYVTTVPSWCSEKKKEVSVHKTLWTSGAISFVIFFSLGIFGALSFQFPSDGDILSVINASNVANSLSKVLVYLFPLVALATTIPVFCIVVRYNLLQSKFPKALANLLAIGLPWVVVIPFLTGNGLNEVLNWGTLLFSSVSNFVIPFIVYLQALNFKKKQRGHIELQLLPYQHSVLTDLWTTTRAPDVQPPIQIPDPAQIPDLQSSQQVPGEQAPAQAPDSPKPDSSAQVPESSLQVPESSTQVVESPDLRAPIRHGDIQQSRESTQADLLAVQVESPRAKLELDEEHFTTVPKNFPISSKATALFCVILLSILLVLVIVLNIVNVS